MSDLLADSYSILIRWKNYFRWVLNVHGVSDVRQMEVLWQANPLLGNDCKISNYTTAIFM
jgi:hypothetical protein